MSMGVLKKGSIFALTLVSFVFYQNCAPIESNSGANASALNAAASYQKVQGILNASCIQCHSNPTATNRNIGLATYQAIIDSGIMIAGNSEASRLYQVVRDGTMPQNRPSLSNDDINAIRDWIDLGAPDAEGNASNDVPVINIVGGDQTVQEGGNAVEFFAVINDRDGAVLRTVWTVVSGPSHPQDSPLSLAGINSPRLTVDDYIEGTYVLQILVEDDQRAISTAQVRLIVGQAPNQNPTIANFTQNPTDVQEPVSAPVTVRVNADDPDGNNNNLTYQWVIAQGSNGDNATLTNDDQQTVSVDSLEADGNNQATYQLTVTVTDERNGSITRNHTITVSSAANAPPTADIAIPNSTVYYDSGAGTHSITATADDPDGSNANITYSWAVTSPNGATDPTLTDANTATVSISNFDGTVTGESNTYTFTVTATDERGATSSASQQVTVYAFSYATDVQPIFDTSCIGCHGGGTPSAGLNLEGPGSHAALFGVAASNPSDASGFQLVNPGSSSQSELWVRTGVLPESNSLSMPQNQALLPGPTLNIIRTWIDDGAPDN